MSNIWNTQTDGRFPLAEETKAWGSVGGNARVKSAGEAEA